MRGGRQEMSSLLLWKRKGGKGMGKQGEGMEGVKGIFRANVKLLLCAYESQ